MDKKMETTIVHRVKPLADMDFMCPQCMKPPSITPNEFFVAWCN